MTNIYNDQQHQMIFTWDCIAEKTIESKKNGSIHLFNSLDLISLFIGGNSPRDKSRPNCVSLLTNCSK